MGFIGRFLQSLTDLFYPKERTRPYDEAKTVPLSARLLAQALAGEGRRHAAVGFSKSGSMGKSSSEISLLSLMGGADGHNVLPDFGIFGVSQGMGALTLASQASNAAVRAFSASMIEDAVLELLSLENDEDASPFHQAVTDAFQSAVQTVSTELPGASFSMTAGLLFAEIIILGQLGNSPAYIVDHHHIERITGVQGIGEEGSAGSGPNGINLNQPMGNQLDTDLSNEFSIYSRPVPRDGYILLCTQSLTEAIPEHDIQRILLDLQEPQAICDGLVNEAHRRKAEVELCSIVLHFPPDFGSWR
jgi:serine/threonine protein phosphatase PrpC